MTTVKEVAHLHQNYMTPVWALCTSTGEISDWLQNWAISVHIQKIIPVREWPEYELIHAPWRTNRD
jgi:hypothetical protein